MVLSPVSTDSNLCGEEAFLKNRYDTTTATLTQFTFDLYTENIQLICPQGIIDLSLSN